MKTVPAQIDPALLQPVDLPRLKCDTAGCVAVLIAEQSGAVDRCNFQLTAIAETVEKQAAVE